MNEWLKMLALAMITLFLGAILGELGFKGKRLVVLLGTVLLIGMSVLRIGDVIDMLPGIGGEGEKYTVAMLKMIGVGYAFGIASDVCRELGEGSLADAVCLFGRIEILVLSLPFVKMIVEKGIELI